MKIWLLLASFALAASACLPVNAQQTKAQMNTYNNAVIVPNGVGAVTAANLHPLLQNMINSSCNIVDATNCPISSLNGATAGLPLIGLAGGGVGQGTVLGTTTAFPVVDGTHTNGQCAVFDASGGLTSVACSPSGSGTVGSGLQGQVAGYIANGTSVVGIPANCIAIEAYAGGTGVSDNGVALNSALAALPTAGGCIAFGAGTYTFTTPIVFTFPNAAASIRLQGSGLDGTILSWGSPTTAYTFTWANQLNTLHMRDMSVTTSGVGASIGVLMTSALVNSIISGSSDFTNVSFRGANGPFSTQFWSIAVKDVNVSNVTGLNTWFYGSSSLTGVGFLAIGVVSPQSFVDDVDFIGGGCEGMGECYWIDTRVFYAQLTSAVASEANYAIYVPAQSPGNTSLQVVGNEFSTNIAAIGTAGTGIIGAATITGNTFGINAGAGANGKFIQSSFTNNWISSNTGTPSGIIGINFLSGSQTNIVTGNIFSGMAEGVGNNTGSTGLNIQSNVYSGNTQNIAQQAGATMQVGGSCAATGSGTCTAGATN